VPESITARVPACMNATTALFRRIGGLGRANVTDITMMMITMIEPRVPQSYLTKGSFD
jgi:hypothetical protein